CGGNSKIIQYLIDKGADIEGTISNNVTPLEYAIHNQWFKNVKCLVDNGANINRISSNNTPISMALSYQNLEILQYLIENGADIHDENAILDFRYVNLKIAKYLVSIGFDARRL